MHDDTATPTTSPPAAATGAGLATLAGGGFAGYLACAVMVLAGCLPYVLLRRDQVLPPDRRPGFELRGFLRGFWLSPRAYPDFAWAWTTRFLINLGNAIALLYLFFFLMIGIISLGEGLFRILVSAAFLTVVCFYGSLGWHDSLASLGQVRSVGAAARGRMKVQAAPCQRPPSTIVISRLRLVSHASPRLPPSGMYR